MTPFAPSPTPRPRPARRVPAGDPWVVYRHTVDDYHRMLKTGVIREGEPFELLDGQVVRKLRNATGADPTIGTDHQTAVDLLAELRPKLNRQACSMRNQAPVTLPPYDETEPDGAIVRGGIEDYERRHPGAADILCAIEVADASLGRDRDYKQAIYAESGIPVYVIVNLIDRVVEVYTDPLKGTGRYGQSVTLRLGQSITFPTANGPGLKVPVRKLLPTRQRG